MIVSRIATIVSKATVIPRSLTPPQACRSLTRSWRTNCRALENQVRDQPAAPGLVAGGAGAAVGAVAGGGQRDRDRPAGPVGGGGPGAGGGVRLPGRGPVLALPRRRPRGRPGPGPPRGRPAATGRPRSAGRARLYPGRGDPAGRGPARRRRARGRRGGRRARDADPTRRRRWSWPVATRPSGCSPPSWRRRPGVRLIALPRSSRAALELLGQGLVHVGRGPPGAIGDGAGRQRGRGPRARSGRVTSCSASRAGRKGSPSAPRGGSARSGEAVRSDLRWIGREAGSGARQCLDELLGGRRPPRRLAADHRGRRRGGPRRLGRRRRLPPPGQRGGRPRLPRASARRRTTSASPTRSRDDPRLQALVNAVRSTAYRRLLGELPGYDSRETGELRRVV